MITYLPYSGRRYWFDESNAFHSRVGKVTEKDNKVKISWIFGYKEYPIDFLLVIARIPNNLPTHLWERIVPLKGIGKNGEAILGYRFDEPVEYEEYKDYFYIPYFTTYGINRKGSVINLTTGKNKSFYKTKPVKERNTKGGYFNTRVNNDFGKSCGLLRHRAVCLVFKEYEIPAELLVVNHKDGIPGNDTPDNLEWCTYSDNNIHAINNGLTPNRHTPVLLKNIKSGEIEKFHSIKACSRFFNGDVSVTKIQFRAAKRSRLLLKGKWLIKYDDGTSWPENLWRSQYHDSVDVVGRNVFTGECIVASNCEEMSRLTGINRATVLNHARNETDIPTNGWNFRYLTKGATWPLHTKRHIEVYKASPRKPKDGCFLIDKKGNRSFFTSFRSAADHLNVNIGHLFDAASKGYRIKDKYKVERFSIRKTLRSVPMET